MHAGWPDDRGLSTWPPSASTVADAGLADVPVVIELFYPFEMR